MAENDDGQEKTQEPTGKRLGDAREKGQLAKTRELYGLVSIVVGLGGLLFYIFPLSKRVLHFAVSIYAQIPYTEFNDAVLGQLIQYIVYTLANVLALPMLFLWAILMVVGFAQNRFVLPKESLKFDPTRLNPIKGFKEKAQDPLAIGSARAGQFANRRRGKQSLLVLQKIEKHQQSQTCR